MPTQTRSFSSYGPDANVDYAVPVQEGSVYNLCPAVTPQGRGILSWVDRTANALRCAVLDSRDDLFVDDVVEAGDVRTIWSGGGTVWTGSVAVVDGALYAFVSWHSGANGRVECYVANDVEDPTSWSLRGTVQNHTAPNPLGTTSVRCGGVPTVLDSGRWVLPFHSWLTFAGSALEDGIGVHYSDNQGATWATVVNDRKGAIFGGTAGPQSTTVAYDPTTGLLTFGSFIGSVSQWRVYRSADGASWTNVELPSGGLIPHYYMDDESFMYAALASATDMTLYRVGDADDFSTWDDLDLLAIDGDTTNHEDGFQVVPLIQGSDLWAVAFTMKNRIAGRARGGFKIRQVGLG